MGWGGNLKNMVRKYGRVAVGVHLSISGLCFSGCYLAILSSVDVEGLIDRVGLGAWLPAHQPPALPSATSVDARSAASEAARSSAGALLETTPAHPSASAAGSESHTALSENRDGPGHSEGETSSRQAKGSLWDSLSVAKGGGAFALAWLCNKALFPVRVPITIGLTPPVWRFLISKGFKV